MTPNRHRVKRKPSIISVILLEEMRRKRVKTQTSYPWQAATPCLHHSAGWCQCPEDTEWQCRSTAPQMPGG